MICHPNAKINLGLNVTERRPDGYHNLETVFYPIPLCDTLQFSTDAGTDSHRPEGIFPNGIPVQEHSTEDYTFRSGGIDIDCPPEPEPAHQGPAPDTGTLCTPPPLYIVA